MTRPMSLMIDGWMPSVGSSRTSSVGPAASARAIASCCCWPPERSPPRRWSICFSTGKSSNSSVGSGVRPRLVGQAHREVFLHREAAEDLAPLRHVADAAANALVRRVVRDVGAAEADTAGAHRHDAHQALQQRRLADAVAAEDHRDLAGCRLEARRCAGCASRRSTDSATPPSAAARRLCARPRRDGSSLPRPRRAVEGARSARNCC